ncbi:MAG TPA: hypothetical protein VFS40_00075 [Gemmatimonadales bacterium]|nr:hypothetical protein [Gemmatimonadales bacterium]
MTRRGRATWVAVAVLTALVLARPARLRAQGDCFPPDDSHEAKTFAIVSVPLVFSGADAPTDRLAPAAGPLPVAARLRVGLEGAYVPQVDAVTRTPTLCRPGKGPDNANLLNVLPRPRVSVLLGRGVGLEASWIPPVRVWGVRANLVALALDWTRPLGARAALGLRAHTTLGGVRAPITCPDEALQDPASECFAGQRSDDSFHPNLIGAEAALGWRAGHGFAPYAGVGYTHLAPRFRVDFTNRVGETDRRRIEVDLDRVAAFAGATWRLIPALTLTGELYAVPADAVTGRLVLRTGL